MFVLIPAATVGELEGFRNTALSYFGCFASPMILRAIPLSLAPMRNYGVILAGVLVNILTSGVGVREPWFVVFADFHGVRKCSHHNWFQATKVMSLNVESDGEAHVCLWRADRTWLPHTTEKNRRFWSRLCGSLVAWHWAFPTRLPWASASSPVKRRS